MHINGPTQHTQLPLLVPPSSAFSFQLDNRHWGCPMHSNSGVDGIVPFIGIFYVPGDQTHGQSFGASIADQATRSPSPQLAELKWLWHNMSCRNVLGTSL